jgi:hypothetical protein
MGSDVEERHAAASLRQHLAGQPWLTAIGVGRSDDRACLYVYVKRTTPGALKAVPAIWQGFPVIVKRMESPRPIEVY